MIQRPVYKYSVGIDGWEYRMWMCCRDSNKGEKSQKVLVTQSVTNLENGIQKPHRGFVRISEVTEVNNQ